MTGQQIDVDPLLVDEDVRERVARDLVPFLKVRANAGPAADAAINAYRGGPQVEQLVPDVHSFARRRDAYRAINRVLCGLPFEVFQHLDADAIATAASGAVSDIYEPVIAGADRVQGWDPSSPQWNVLRKAVVWRNTLADVKQVHVEDAVKAMQPAAEALVAAVDELPHIGEGAWSWTPPAEPGPEVRRVRPVERYPGDNGIWFDREPDDSGWRLVMANRRGEVIEWLQVVAAAGSVYGGRTLVDATAEREVTDAG